MANTPAGFMSHLANGFAESAIEIGWDDLRRQVATPAPEPTMSDLAIPAEEHVRAALQRAETDFPAFAVDSWSEPAAPGQWVVIEDDEGRRSQVKIDIQITKGVSLGRGSLARSCGKLVSAVLAEVRAHVESSGLIVSRPMPEPVVDGVHIAHMEFRGLWLRLLVRGDTAVLSALLGRGPVPLAEPDEAVVWL